MSITTSYKCDSPNCKSVKEFTEPGACSGQYVPVNHDLGGWSTLEVDVDVSAEPFMLCADCTRKVAEVLGLKFVPMQVGDVEMVGVGDFQPLHPMGGLARRRFRVQRNYPSIYREPWNYPPAPPAPPPSPPAPPIAATE